MREIKFRAWDTEKQNMLVQKEYMSHHIFHMTPDGRCYDNGKLQPFILMQYTGLKDKNGKEIYEGDIVKILHGDWCSQMHAGEDAQKLTHEEYLDSLTIQYEVVFIEGRFIGKSKRGNYNPWMTDDDGRTYSALIPHKHGYIEIIDNVHENPDLIKN